MDTERLKHLRADFDRFYRERWVQLEREQAVERLETFCNERRQLATQERLHRWLHGWLYLHIPLSVALLVTGSAHAFMSLYY